MKTIFDTTVRKELIDRVNNLSPNSPTLFGKMKAPQGLHHINGALQMYLGELSFPYHGNNFKSAILRLFTFSPMPIPKEKAQTVPPLISEGEYDIEAEKARFADLIERVASQANLAEWPVSPIFGKLTVDKYGKLGYKHTDHHLKQFGV